jgi:enediyne polyketide synthase
MSTNIAILGMACRYPDAATPEELWENVLAGRRAFRRIPSERLRAEDYFSADPDAVDRTYAAEAAVIDGYEFDRVGFRVSGSAYRSADLAHWLALDIAARALADAGFTGGEGLPRETTGVLVGNTLTGEFSRAGLMRLRWPYVRRTVEAELEERTDWTAAERRAFLDRLETTYKAPFPAGTEETLAGGLANTIAGRICNYFDLNGGGYTVDGACASSLLAVTTACSALAADDLDAALAGGVDLSIDPFELIGFARARALAADEMRVYDARSAGFWPGEGCGMVVLMREEDALAQGRRILAVIRGWGVSSDGDGGITRPEVEGQLLALRRAYRRAGFGADTVGYFEGHGTGTAVGDGVELQALTRIRREGDPIAPPAAVGSVKANIGHTKAAAGMAGLIKATQAVRTQILPPITGCETPRPELAGENAALRAPAAGELWPEDRPLRAAVSAMGFGGINTHVVLEGAATERRRTLTEAERQRLRSAQDCELFLLAGMGAADLLQQAEQLASIAPRLSRAECTDLAAHLARSLQAGPVRAALVAAKPAELVGQLDALKIHLATGTRRCIEPKSGLYLNHMERTPRIGFLFPGQGSPARPDGGAWQRRFTAVSDLYGRLQLPAAKAAADTEFAQPAITAASLGGLAVLNDLGIRAEAAIGHSLGELCALHWAGAWDAAGLLRIARVRGRAMADMGAPTGRMCSVAAAADRVQALIAGEPVVIAGYNSHTQTVISGPAHAIETVIARAAAQNLPVTPLPVSHAFHSPLVAAAVPALARQLYCEPTGALRRRVVSTVTGAELSPDVDIAELLQRQVTDPVRFIQAVSTLQDEIDLWIEVGPGRVLTGLASTLTAAPAIAADACAAGVRGLLMAVGAAYALGAEVDVPALFADRFTCPFDPNRKPQFFVNPCELAPIGEEGCSAFGVRCSGVQALEQLANVENAQSQHLNTEHRTPMVVSALDHVRRLVAERAELPIEAVRAEFRLLSDLHLNSISVGQIAVEAARLLGTAPPFAPTEYANAAVSELAQALEEAAQVGDAGGTTAERYPAGLDSWVRAFKVEHIARRRGRDARRAVGGDWRIFAPEGHALATQLRASNALPAGTGVMVCLPPQPNERHVGLLLEGARAVIARKTPAMFAVVQQDGGGAGFARTLSQEQPDLDVAVVDLPQDHPQALDWLLAEIAAARGYTEARYDQDGNRFEPRLRLLPLNEPVGAVPVGPEDVMLITGGGKGIGAECGLALSRETGVRLALLGRSAPEADPELAQNLERMAAAGVRFHYLRADVGDVHQVHAAMRKAEAVLGPITAILHSAGVNQPQLISGLDEEAFLRTLTPKIQGARNLLAAVDPGRLKLFVAFGSVIARTGLPGEADYSTANEWLTCLTERLQADCPHCRCLAVEWSAWSGAGMAERMGSVNHLLRHGITPIPVEIGVRLLNRLLRSAESGAVTVAGRLGDPLTLCSGWEELPLRRFLERPRVYVEGVELIAEADLSTETDPYLDDHVFQGDRIFPGVAGLEAMAQAAQAVIGAARAPVFEQIEFLHPIVAPAIGTVAIRVLALVREAGDVEVAIRCETTGFQKDHFRAVCRFDAVTEAAASAIASPLPLLSVDPAALSLLDLEPKRDLYGGILFHSGRFQRLRGYRLLRATECIAEIEPETAGGWFGRYLPGERVLGDLAAHDTAIHAIQACIPHTTLLPIGVDRLIPDTRQTNAPRFVRARERFRSGDLFVYDVEVLDEAGVLQGCWEGLRLQAMSGTPHRPAVWAAPLIGPLIERQVQELALGSTVRVALERKGTGENARRVRSSHALRQALGETVRVLRRPDGKPELPDSEMNASTSHAGDLTLAVVGPGAVGCDLEAVTARSESVWRDLLGPERYALAMLLAAQTGEDADTAATQVWSACECLIKAGSMSGAPLMFEAATPDGWVVLRSGRVMVLSGILRLYRETESLSFTLAIGEEDARL